MDSRSSVVVMTIFCLTLAVRQCAAQFPRVCAANASLDGGVCCPSMPDDPNGPVCGGPLRGSCQRINSVCPSQRSRVARWLRNDDRLDWPLSFFSYSCSCIGNFWGYACHRCRPGWWGDSCNIQGVGRIRRNALTMTTEQKRIFREVMTKSRTVQSDWVVMNISSRQNGDPIGSVPTPIPFYNVSVYDFIVYTHFYSARSSLLSNMDVCRGEVHRLDLAHKGPGFPSWHRRLLIEFEYELGEVQKRYTNSTELFAMPYWDWVEGTNCSVCTNDLAGALNTSDPNMRLDSGSVFYNWRNFCKRRAGLTDCHTCDPTRRWNYLWRAYSNDAQHKELPKQTDIDYIMSLPQLDLPPYSTKSNASSFRNNLEGFINASNNAAFANDYMHNLVHMYINGSNNDVAGSPNEPLFWFHHSFVDKIYEMWIRKYNIDATSLPLEAQPGHARYDPLVPFFPRTLQHESVGRSETFGFTYDNEFLGSKEYPAPAKMCF